MSTDVRRTPDWLFDALHAEFHFGLDAAADQHNAKVWPYLGPDHDRYPSGLSVSWADVLMTHHGELRPVWLNPPYSRGSIPVWCAKATEEADKGVTTVMLLPADTSTRYFHKYVLPNEHRFLKTRLKFEGAPLDKHGKLPPAKFGSVIVVFRPPQTLWSVGR